MFRHGAVWQQRSIGPDRVADAVASYRTALAGPGAEVLGRDAELRLHLGVLLEKLGRDQEAIAAFRAAVTMAPDLRDARFNLGLALKRRGALAESVEHLTRVAELDPADTGVRLELAGALGLLGRVAEAIAMIEAARVAEPDNVRMDLELALALARGGRFADAVVAYDRFLTREPVFTEAHVGRAMALLFADQCAVAGNRLEEGLRLVPGDLQLQHLLARILATCPDSAGRNGARALTLAQGVMAKQQTLDHAETLAMALAEAGQFAEATTWQSRILAEAERQGWAARLPALRARLASYEQGQAVRAPWR